MTVDILFEVKSNLQLGGDADPRSAASFEASSHKQQHCNYTTAPPWLILAEITKTPNPRSVHLQYTTFRGTGHVKGLWPHYLHCHSDIRYPSRASSVLALALALYTLS